MDDSQPLLQSATPQRSNSVQSSGARRRSRLTSGGRWDWAYEPEGSRFYRASNTEAAFTSIKFRVLHIPEGPSKFFFKGTEALVAVSVPDRCITICSGKRRDSFLTSSVSRLTQKNSKVLEIRIPRSSQRFQRPWPVKRKNTSTSKTFEFDSIQERDEFLRLVHGLNSMGGTVSSMFHRVGSSMSADLLVKGLLAYESETNHLDVSGYEPPSPHNPIDETEFFRWFLLVSQDQDATALLRKLEDTLLGDSSSVSQETFKTSDDLPSTIPSSSTGNMGKRGSLFLEPTLDVDETVELVEDNVTLVHKLEEVQHVIGELILTNYRICFSVYQSEMIISNRTSTSQMAMTGVGKLATYLMHDEDARPEAIGVQDESCQCETQLGMHKDSELFASLPSLRYGRRPNSVLVAINIPLASICSTGIGSFGLLCESSWGRTFLFQFDRGDKFLEEFRNKLLECRKQPFYQVASLKANEDNVLMYNATKEYMRQNPRVFNTFAIVEQPNYEICATYPKSLLLPCTMTDLDKIQAVGKFRSRGRIPIPTWFHPTNQSILSRSSQPMTGIKQQRCQEDQTLLSSLRPEGNRIVIVDARGPAAVAGNQLVRGKGAEVPSDYPESIFLFMGIGNIHTMRQSYEKLTTACNDVSSSKFYSRVEQSSWLHHIRLILEASCRCAELLELEGSSVLIHCSDGWDRTAQLSSLTQIILDPHFRTLQGLFTLIEKDWVSFGFKFFDRCHGGEAQMVGRHDSSMPNAEEKSPVWIQFVDCLFQILNQFPDNFEYNESLLVELALAPYHHRFMTFAFNSEKERSQACYLLSETSKKPISSTKAYEFWNEVQARQDEFKNLNFQPYTSSPLWPHTSPRRMVLWDKFHMKSLA